MRRAVAKKLSAPTVHRMTNNPALRNGVFAFEVSCLLRAASLEEAQTKVHCMMAFADRYWVEEGPPVTEDDIADMPGPYRGFTLREGNEVRYDSSKPAA